VVGEQLGGLGGLLGDVVRRVSDVDTIKALADPTRLSILRALMDDHGRRPRVMSAKELAEELGEPQTKLYRHLKVLESAGLIEVAETRLVSGIVETRYRAAQRDIRVDTDAAGAEADDEVIAMIGAGLENYRERLVANGRRGGFPLHGSDPDAPRVGGAFMSGFRLPAAKAAELDRRLHALLMELEAEPNDPDGIAVEMLLCWFGRVEDPRPGSPDSPDGPDGPEGDGRPGE
jgi:DNA-binding transcriptional ArsR family regulator